MIHGLAGSRPNLVDSPYAWLRLGVGLALATIGNAGMWTYQIALPSVQAEFGTPRADATLPFTFAMAGFGIGNAILGRVTDRIGLFIPILFGIASFGVGYTGSGLAQNVWALSACHLIVGFGAATFFGPLISDTSHWFLKRRGIAVSIAATGNYVAGAIWPALMSFFIAGWGWRATHIGVAIIGVALMLPLSLMFRKRTETSEAPAEGASATAPDLGVSPNTLFALLWIAGVGCCVAMAMPQVHIVAYCGDLGYGVARGAEMLSLMLFFGILSRVGSGFFADRFGGVITLLVGTFMQAVALTLYLFFDGLASLFLISALFGLVQGGIVPSYAVIIRQYFSPDEAGARVGTLVLGTVIGMALGGWMSGAIFDWTGSYRAAFANGILWNLVTLAVALWLLHAGKPKMRPAAA